VFLSSEIDTRTFIRLDLIPSVDGWVSRKVSSAGQQDKSTKKNTAAEIISKRSKIDDEEPSSQRMEKMIKAAKRDTSSSSIEKRHPHPFFLGASKPSVIPADKTPLKPTASKRESRIPRRTKPIESSSSEKRRRETKGARLYTTETSTTGRILLT
jgi:hypothetical protein